MSKLNYYKKGLWAYGEVFEKDSQGAESGAQHSNETQKEVCIVKNICITVHCRAYFEKKFDLNCIFPD